MKSRTGLLLLVAIGCGLLAAFLTSQLIKPGEEKVQLVVAAREVPRGTLVKDADEFFKLQAFPKESAPPTALRSLDAVRNRVTLRTLDPGQICSGRDVGEEDNFTRDLPPGHLALAVPVTLHSSVAGYVQPGARVDLLCTVPHPTDTRLKFSKIFMNKVLVLAVNQVDARTAETPRPNVNPAVVTLAVTPEQAEKLTWLRDAGPVTMALRRPNDNTSHDTPGTVSPFDWPPVPSWQPATATARVDPPTPTPTDETWTQLIFNGGQPTATVHRKPTIAPKK